MFSKYVRKFFTSLHAQRSVQDRWNLPPTSMPFGESLPSSLLLSPLSFVPHGLKLQGNFVLEQLAINKCHVGVSDIRWEQFLQDAKVIFEANCWELLPQMKLFNRKWTEQWLPVACWFCYLFNSQRGNRLLFFFDWPAWSFQKTDEVGTEEGEQQGMAPLTECVTLLYFKWSFRGVWGEPPATQRNRRDRPVWFALVIVDNWI